ncbi:MAG: phosphoribosylaminoimidazolesuccinocarboxamide synthase [Chthoniobacterales bacterium]
MEINLLQCNLPGIQKVASGKVREIFDLGDSLLLVATDRISAFDCILPNAIPHKGEVLTGLSEFWFSRLNFIPNHLITTQVEQFPQALQPHREQLRGRSMLVKKTSPLPVECVARGYLIGSGWEEYKKSGSVCGQKLPPNLQMADKLEETLFTPATKAASGHDENISWNECRRILGEDIALQVRKWTIELYEHGRAYAATRGIIIADTKFEFGVIDGDVILIDEVLTPDSSRFWAADKYAPGSSPPSFDKQFVRDYLNTLDWNKEPPAPSLPEEVVKKTSEKYQEAWTLLASSLSDL